MTLDDRDADYYIEQILLLKNALQEALEGWEHAEAVADLDEYGRIAQLRKQFLES